MLKQGGEGGDKWEENKNSWGVEGLGWVMHREHDRAAASVA